MTDGQPATAARRVEIEWVAGLPMPKPVEHDHDFPAAQGGQTTCSRCKLTIAEENMLDIFRPCLYAVSDR